MIGTHTVKMLQGSLRQDALRARIVGPVPRELVCSQTVAARRELFALPRNAADIKQELQQAALEGGGWTAQVPDIQDGRIKQVLLPLENWREGGYVSVTPVTSCAVSNELHFRLGGVSRLEWVLQPSPVALANHGEGLLRQNGRYRLLRRGVASPRPSAWRGDFVLLTARAEGMNVSNGMVSAPWPAITAIGGAVHAIEREIGCDVRFALGARRIERRAGGKLFSNARPASPTSRALKLTPGLALEEVLGNAEIVLLLQCKGCMGTLAEAAGKLTRLAGGSLFDVTVSVERNAAPPAVAYLRDASVRMPLGRRPDGDPLQTAAQACEADFPDALDAALIRYREGLAARREVGRDAESFFSLAMSGYALLEQPTRRARSRGGYPHAWAEPVFSLVNQGPAADDMWWEREGSEGLIRWKGAS